MTASLRLSWRTLRPRLLLCLSLAASPARATGPAGEFLDTPAVRDALVGHTLKGRDWIEYYTAAGEILGKARYFGIHRYSGRWSVQGSKVCYVYDHPQANTCSYLRRDGERVTHHLDDGTLKKDGEAVRLPGNRLDQF